MRIPREKAEAIARRFPDGAAFLATLDERLDEYAQRWDLTLGDPLPIGIGGYLVEASGDAVLKLSPDPAIHLEVYALRRYAGRGAAKLLEADPDGGALLLQRARPGTTLDALPDEEMVRQGCALARRLQRAPDEEDRARLPGEGDTVCHGDLNPGNVLAHEDGWMAIDPLPRLADPDYDAVSLVWAKREWLFAQPDPKRIVERRLELAAADPERLRALTLQRIDSLLAERARWGGYDEGPFRRLADLIG